MFVDFKMFTLVALLSFVSFVYLFVCLFVFLFVCLHKDHNFLISGAHWEGCEDLDRRLLPHRRPEGVDLLYRQQVDIALITSTDPLTGVGAIASKKKSEFIRGGGSFL